MKLNGHLINGMMSTGADQSKGPNGLASCNIFDNEISLEFKCSPPTKSGGKSRRKSMKLKDEHSRVPHKVGYQRQDATVSDLEDEDPVDIIIDMNQSAFGSGCNMDDKPSTPTQKGKSSVGIIDDTKSQMASYASKTTLKPLKSGSSSASKSHCMDADEMERLYNNFLESNTGTVEIIAPPTPAPPLIKPRRGSKIQKFIQAKFKKRSEKKKEFLNDNILTQSATTIPVSVQATPSPKMRSLRFLRKKLESKPVSHTKDLVKTQVESPTPLERNNSVASDPTVETVESNSFVNTTAEDTTVAEPTFAAGEGDMIGDNNMDVSVFHVIEHYTGVHHCSPILPHTQKPKQFEINKQAELLARIEELQNELTESKGWVQELTQELDEVYSEKDYAIHRLDRMIETARINDDVDDDSMLREIRMYLTDRTEPTISSITTTSSEHYYPDEYDPFCSCLNTD